MVCKHSLLSLHVFLKLSKASWKHRRSKHKIGKKKAKGEFLRPCSKKRNVQRVCGQEGDMVGIHDKNNTSKLIEESSKLLEDKVNDEDKMIECPQFPLAQRSHDDVGSCKLVEESRKLMGNKVCEEDVMIEFPRLPLAPPMQKPKPGVIFVLEKASLSLACVGNRYQILNPDEHAVFLRKKKMDPYKYRPDIVHEALREIMDSRLRMAGRLRAIYVKTDDGVLIKVEPCALIPESFERFCSMMVELLQKFRIKAVGKHGKLLRVIANPVTRYLPINSHKIGLSFSSKKAIELHNYVSCVNHDEDLVFVVGVMAHGKIDCDYIDDLISVSSVPLTSATCLRLIECAIERKWGIW